MWAQKKIIRVNDKPVDHSNLSAKDQAIRMAEDYRTMPTANTHLAGVIKKWANDIKDKV